MNEKYLLPNEEIISKAGDNSLTLTNFRIRFSKNKSGKLNVISALLSNISSIEINYKSKPVYGIIAIIFISLGIFIFTNGHRIESAISSVLIGAVFISVYFSSRKHAFTITTHGGKQINFKTSGISETQVLKFTNDIESAMLKQK